MPNILRKLAAASILGVGVGILAFSLHESGNAGNKDFTSYWAAGQLLIRHGNPYSPADVLVVEKSAGFRPDRALIMRNPPYALVLALPLGLMSATVAALFWSLLLVLCIVLSLRVLWATYGSPPDRSHLFGYMFVPVLTCIYMGQTGALALLGVTMFLRWYENRPLLAGICLSLLAIKPHLFLPFGLTLLLWVAATRSYRIVVGACLALAAATLVVLWFDPLAWTHYLPVFKDAQGQFTFSIGSAIRSLVNPASVWLEFIPATIGCVWAVRYFLGHREGWSWSENGPLLLLVSLFAAPYAFLADEVIALPAILHGLFRHGNEDRYFLTFLAMNGIGMALLFAGVAHDSGLYAWTTPAWLAWYVWTMASTGSTVRSTLGKSVAAQ